MGDTWASNVESKTFTLDNSLTVASVKKDSDTQITLTLTSGQALPEGDVKITIPQDTTTGNKKVNQSGTSGEVTLSPTSAGYKVSPGTATHAGGTGTGAVTFTAKGGIQPGATYEFTVTGLTAYEKLGDKDKDFTVTGGGSVTAVDAENNKFTYTAPSTPATVTTKIEVTIVINTVKKTKALAASDLDATDSGYVITKPYDGKTAGPATLGSSKQLVVDSSKLTTGKTGVKIQYTSAAFDKADKTASKITLSGVTVVDTTADSGDSTYYTVPGTLELTGATITPADPGAITAEVPGVKTNSGKDAVLKAIKDAPVFVANIEDDNGQPVQQGTVKDYFNTDADIETQLKGASNAAKFYTGPETAEAKTLASDLSTETEKNVNRVITGDSFVFPAGYTYKVAVGDNTPADDTDKTGTSVTWTQATKTLAFSGTQGDVVDKITVVATPTGGTSPDDDITFVFDPQTLAQPEAEKWDFSQMNGEDIDINLTFTGAATAGTALGDNFAVDNSDKIAVTIPVTKGGGSPAGPSGFGITFDTKGYVVADSTYLEADGEGKLTSMPTAKVVKGGEFWGWSTDGTKEHVMPLDHVYDQDTTLYAVVTGYLNGDKDTGKVRAQSKVKRAELIKMLVVASGAYDHNKTYEEPSFDDAKGRWFSSYIACAEELDIVKGYEDGTARPDAPVTREETAALIARTFGVEVVEGATTDKVADFDDVQDWAKKYVAALCDNTTIDGYPEDDGTYTFRGDRDVKRNESVKMVNKYLGLTDADKEEIAADTELKWPFTDAANRNSWDYADIMFASLSVPAEYYSMDITIPSAE